jgi:hypothetical protein
VSASPTSRTLDALRRAGILAAVVERWNPHAKIRQDLFGFVDLVAVDEALPGVLAIQATSQSNAASRVAKVLEEPRAAVWLAAGNRVQVWGWRKLKRREGRKLWRARVVRLELVDGEVVPADPVELDDLLAYAPGGVTRS